MVGVTSHTEGNEEAFPETLRIGVETEEAQCKRLEKILTERNGSTVEEALTRLKHDARDSTTNLMPTILDAVRAHATVGEMVNAMADVFGRYEEAPRI